MKRLNLSFVDQKIGYKYFYKAIKDRSVQEKLKMMLSVIDFTTRLKRDY